MLENVRHFIIHPNPDENEFQKYSKILVQDPSIFLKFPQIASDIITHFYHSAQKEIPLYLSSNQIFIVSEVTLLK